MRATLEFYLPEELAEYNDATRGTQYKIAIMDCLNELRNKLKYGESDGTHAGIEVAQRVLLAACDENGFDPWDES